MGSHYSYAVQSFDMKSAASRAYEFGSFRVIPEERLLLRHGGSVHLSTKAFDTLLVLIRSAGRLVSRSELMSVVWADACVEEANITLAISMLRKALGDESKQHRYIETISKFGYRFVCEVREVVSSKFALAERSFDIRSVAVLPFICVARPAHENLGLGLADAIITKLAKTGIMVVRPTSAVVKYANALTDVVSVGREQGVDAILTGHVEVFANRIRLTGQLVRVADESLLWADMLDECPHRLLALEDEVVKRLVRWMSIPERVKTSAPRLPEADSNESSQAYRSYLEGRYFWNKRTEQGLRRSIECFQKAISEKPQYAVAHAGLADAYALLGTYGQPTVETYSLAKTTALKALQLDDSLAEPHVSLGIVYFYYECNLSKAEDEFRRAIALNPSYALAHSWYALNLGASGREEEALDHVRYAQELDPLSLQINTVAGRIFYFLRQYDQSVDAYRRVIDLDPQYARVHTRLGITYAAMGAFEEAIQEFAESKRLSPLDPYLAGYLGHVHALTGDTREARRLLKKLSQQPHALFSAGLIWMGLGKRDEAMECLAKAHETHCFEIVYAKAEPLLDSLRSDPRFGTLINSTAFS